MQSKRPTNKLLPKHGLYAITDAGLTPEERLSDCVSKAIEGGAVMVQYRNKNADEAQRDREAHLLRDVCHAHRIPLIINDFVDLAHRVGAQGVHLGKNDPLVHEARAVLGDSAIIGVSCYNEFQRALRAQQSGADYVAFGSFHPTGTKEDTVRAKIELLQEARKHLHIPVVAIGGITPENGRPLVHAGASLLAACSGVFGQPDIESAARHYAHLFSGIGKTFIV